MAAWQILLVNEVTKQKNCSLYWHLVHLGEFNINDFCAQDFWCCTYVRLLFQCPCKAIIYPSAQKVGHSLEKYAQLSLL